MDKRDEFIEKVTYRINFPGNFMCCFPDEIEITEEGNDLSEMLPADALEQYYLWGFERDAKSILRSYDLPTDDLAWVTFEDDAKVGWVPEWEPTKPLPDDVIFAVDVMKQLARMRILIDNKETEKAIICAFKLLGSSINSRYYGFTKRGIRQQTAVTKKKPPRTLCGVLLFILQELTNNPGLQKHILLKKLAAYKEEHPWTTEEGNYEYGVFTDSDGKIMQRRTNLNDGSSIISKPLSRSTVTGTRYYHRIKKSVT